MDFDFFFVSIIEQFEKNKMNYAILRGYENLPYSYSNDLDFCVESDLDILKNCLAKIASLNNLKIKIRDSRFEVIKLTFYKEHIKIDLDFWFGFNFVGLYYLNISDILQKSKEHNGFKILDVNDELSLSFLKELLHMKRLRKDKASLLNKKLELCDFDLFATYFNKKLRNEFIYSIKNNNYRLNSLSKKAKKDLLKQNLKLYSFIPMLKNIFKFIYFRLFPNQNPIVKEIKGVITSDLF